MRDFITRNAKALDLSGAISFSVVFFWLLFAGASPLLAMAAFFAATAFVLSMAIGRASRHGDDWRTQWVMLVICTIAAVASFIAWVLA